MNLVVKYEVVIYGQSKIVETLQEAENLMRRHEYSDFAPSYILKKEYTKRGKLLDVIVIF